MEGPSNSWLPQFAQSAKLFSCLVLPLVHTFSPSSNASNLPQSCQSNSRDRLAPLDPAWFSLCSVCSVLGAKMVLVSRACSASQRLSSMSQFEDGKLRKEKLISQNCGTLFLYLDLCLSFSLLLARLLISPLLNFPPATFYSVTSTLHVSQTLPARNRRTPEAVQEQQVATWRRREFIIRLFMLSSGARLVREDAAHAARLCARPLVVCCACFLMSIIRDTSASPVSLCA